MFVLCTYMYVIKHLQIKKSHSAIILDSVAYTLTLNICETQFILYLLVLCVDADTLSLNVCKTQFIPYLLHIVQMPNKG